MISGRSFYFHDPVCDRSRSSRNDLDTNTGRQYSDGTMLKWISNWFAQLRDWWRGRPRRNDFAGVVIIDASADATNDLRAWKLVLVGTPEKAKWLRFECPCRCGEILALNLMRSHSPHWVCERHVDGTLTVHPSVDATKCGSHFWIRRSVIHWV